MSQATEPEPDEDPPPRSSEQSPSKNARPPAPVERSGTKSTRRLSIAAGALLVVAIIATVLFVIYKAMADDVRASAGPGSLGRPAASPADAYKASPDSYQISIGVCVITDGKAVINGLITNLSGEKRQFLVDARMVDASEAVGVTTDDASTSAASTDATQGGDQEPRTIVRKSAVLAPIEDSEAAPFIFSVPTSADPPAVSCMATVPAP